MAKEKEKIVPIEKKPKKAGTLFATLMAIISLLAGIYMIMQYYGLYTQEIPKLYLAGIMILTGLSSLAQISKIILLKRIERIKGRYI